MSWARTIKDVMSDDDKAVVLSNLRYVLMHYNGKVVAGSGKHGYFKTLKEMLGQDLNYVYVFVIVILVISISLVYNYISLIHLGEKLMVQTSKINANGIEIGVIGGTEPDNSYISRMHQLCPSGCPQRCL